MRDSQNQTKSQIFKIVKAIVNKKLFIFYNKHENFIEIFNMIVKTFNFTKEVNTSFYS